MRNIILAISLIATLSLFGIYIMKKKSNIRNSATFGVVQIAFSSDPLDYDYLTHHYAFSSVFAKLVSYEKNGTFFPMLASSWSNSNNFTTWKFIIREDLTYSNGDKIKLDDIKLNFKRLVYLKNKNDSKSGLLEFLEGFSNFKDISQELPGIRILNNEIIFTFTKPMPDLLEKISFGFYGLAHPSLYSFKDGSWINKTNVISSGPYTVSRWNEKEFSLKLRDEVSFHDHKNRIREIDFFIFTKVKNAKELNHVDFLVADKQSLLVSSDFEYIGSAENLKIGYVRVNSALKDGSPLTNIEIRKWLRNKFYQGLKKNSFPVTTSFFPTTLRGIKYTQSNYEAPKPNFEHFTITTDPLSFSAKLEENNHKKSIVEFFSDAMNEIGNNSGVNIVFEDRKDGLYDIEILGTGVEANDYWNTVKFMFLSKEGIRLPDLSGKALNELNKESPDINLINQELWDQAIIWPIRHYTSGYWFNRNSNLDYSEINFNSPAIDFQFLKWKD